MQVIVLITIFLLSFESIAQTDNLETAITRGNWLVEFVSFNRLDTIDHAIGDTVVLSKVPKRLKFKKQRPLRFMKNGSVHQPKTPPLSCGNVSTMEALWYLKWKDASSWEIEEMDGNTIFRFQELQLQLVESSKKEFTFVITD